MNVHKLNNFFKIDNENAIVGVVKEMTAFESGPAGRPPRRPE